MIATVYLRKGRVQIHQTWINDFAGPGVLVVYASVRASINIYCWFERNVGVSEGNSRPYD